VALSYLTPLFWAGGLVGRGEGGGGSTFLGCDAMWDVCDL
jgi:hypothetical protein